MTIRQAAALLAAVLLECSQPSAIIGLPAGYYRSDSIGLALEPLPGANSQEPYLLRVRWRGELEIRTLYQEGKELRRWELTPGLERVFEEVSLAEERTFDGAGRLTSERLFDQGKLREFAQYRFGPSGLASVETYDGDGKLLARQRYELGPGGELRRVRRETPGKKEAEELALVSAEGRLFEERLLGGGRRLVSRFGLEGRVASKETWRQRELLESLELAYPASVPGSAAGSVPLSMERTIAGTRTLTRYDSEGREASRQVSRGGKTIEEWTFQYDAGGNRVLAIRIDDRGTEHWSYFYDAAGALQREEYRARGLLQKVVRYEQEQRVEELYRAGQPFLVVRYRGGVKVREEFLEGGRVVRSREFGANP